MIVTDVQNPDLAWTDDPTRPKGLHLSGIIKDLMIQRDPARYDHAHESPEEHQAGMSKMTTGVQFEQILEKKLMASMYPGLFRPQSINVDGIWMSPDGVDPDEWAIHEYKLTWYSMKKTLPTDPVYWPWLVQIKCYCRAIESLVARLTVFYVNGTYAPPRPHPPVTKRLVFTPRELDACWQMILIHREAMSKRGVIISG